jgi:opacity protein-like surface antigen
MTVNRQFFYRVFGVLAIALAAQFAAMAQISVAETSSIVTETGASAGRVSPTPTPTPKPKTMWGGVYFGAFGGVNLSGSTASTTTTFDANGYFAPTSVTEVNTAGQQKLNATNVTAGATLGYNRQRGKLVYGGEFDFGTASGTNSKSTTGNYSCCPGNFTIQQSAKLSWIATLRPRIGAVVGKRFLVYATGGLAYTKFDYEASFNDTHNAAIESGSINKKRFGWIGGGGVEYMLRKHISVKGEFLHHDFGTVSTTSTNLNINIPPFDITQNPFNHSVTLRGNMARFGVNFHF